MRAAVFGAKAVGMRPIDTAAEAAVLDLNETNVVMLAPMSADELREMTANAFAAFVADGDEGFVIAFDQDAAYDSPNFLWFRDRYERFVYVDRIVIGEAARGKGLGRAFYEALFERARAAGHSMVTCEINREPPNPGSDAFHEKLGFVIVGDGEPSPGKLVRYLARTLR